MKRTLTFLPVIAALLIATPALAQVKVNTDIGVDMNASGGAGQSGTSAGNSGSATVGGGMNTSVSNQTTTSGQTSLVFMPSTESVKTEADESMYASALAKSDTNVESVSLDKQKVSVAYKTNGKLLGFIPVSVPVKATVYATGETTVNYPWYTFMTKTNFKNGMQLDADVRAMVSGSEEMMLSSGERAVLAQRLYYALKANLSAQASGSVN